LRLSGHEVRLAHDGVTALKTAESFQPQVVLLDIGLPGMDGHEVAHRLRCEVGLRDALLAALTGYGQEEDRRRSRAAGIDVHPGTRLCTCPRSRRFSPTPPNCAQNSTLWCLPMPQAARCIRMLMAHCPPHLLPLHYRHDLVVTAFSAAPSCPELPTQAP